VLAVFAFKLGGKIEVRLSMRLDGRKDWIGIRRRRNLAERVASAGAVLLSVFMSLPPIRPGSARTWLLG
jgi:hypothetical protein